jgi:tripartite ATP-independent transporter DctM subunit
MDPLIVGIIGLVLLLVFLYLGINLALSFFIIGFFGLLLVQGPSVLIFVQLVPYTAINSFDFSVIPLFVFMGMLLFHCKIGEDIFRAVRAWLGHLPGGLAAATSGACALIGTMTGSGGATAALMSRVAYPEMTKYKYDKTLSLATCAASSTVAMMIPPSVAIVIYAILAEASIGETLLAGIIPGFLSMGVYMIMLLVRVRIKPELGPKLPPASWNERLGSLRFLLPAVVMMGTIGGGIYFGVFTATEAGGMGSLISLVIALAMRRLTWERFKDAVYETVKFTVMIALVLMAILGFYIRFLNMTGITMSIAGLATTVTSPELTLAVMFAVTFLFGMFIGSNLAFVTIPLFAPIVGDLGFSLVWFVILMIKMQETASITPPVAVVLFISQGVVNKEVSIGDLYKAVWWFVLCDLSTLLLMLFVPQVVLFIPSTMRG